MKVRIIANPVAGGGRGASKAQALERALRGLGVDAEISLTQRAGDAERFAAAGGADCVVSVGGDGTANEVVNGLPDSETALAILPMGTANVVARELRLPTDPERSARLIASGLTRSMDLGFHGERRFLLGGGAGIDAAVVKVVSEKRGNRSGLRHWVGPALREGWNYRHPQMRVTVDGKLVGEDVQYAIVGNCRYSAGVFPATPKARIDDGLLDVCLLRNLGRRRLLTLAFTVWNSSFIKHADVTYAQGRNIEIRPLNGVPIPLQIDGDPRGNIPADFSIRPRALTVIGEPR